jgi:hypothetical protein
VDGATALLITATVTNGVACGATWDLAFKQLPARRRTGAGAYTAYMRAADLWNGLLWYPMIGSLAAVTTVAAVVAGLLGDPSRVEATALWLMAVGAVGALAAMALATPTLLSLRQPDVPGGVDSKLDRFAWINGVRAVAFAIALAATIWALTLTVDATESVSLRFDPKRQDDTLTCGSDERTPSSAGSRRPWWAETWHQVCVDPPSSRRTAST